VRQFIPARIFFESKALDYPLGKELWQRFQDEGKEVRLIASHNRVTGLPGGTDTEKFKEAKQTLVIGIRRGKKFASCRPSADYQLVLSTSCPAMCEYCYLHTTLGRRPVVRLYVNIGEILDEAFRLIESRKPAVTVFEGAATSDPLPLEPYSGALAEAITFFSRQKYGRFRFVTKFTGVDSLLDLPHNGHTAFRFSVNTHEVIRRYEHRTPVLDERLTAAVKVSEAGYPTGFLIAPVFLFKNWQESYMELLQNIAGRFPTTQELTFELVSHRFTPRGKENIHAIFPGTSLPLDKETRQFKYGQFGYGKYLYPAAMRAEAQDFFRQQIAQILPHSHLLYFV
jgi:spore photoproduct lyase